MVGYPQSTPKFAQLKCVSRKGKETNNLKNKNIIMKIIFQIGFLTLLMIPGTNLKAQDINCILKGTVVDRESKELLLSIATEDARFNSIKIPVIDNQFSYKLNVPVAEKYELSFTEEFESGSWRPIAFFPYNGTIEFIIHKTEDYSKNEIVGGQLNNKMIRFEEQRDSIFQPLLQPYYDEYYSLKKSNQNLSEKAKILFEKIRNTSDEKELDLLYKENELLQMNDEIYTLEAKTILTKLDSVQRVKTLWENDYIKNNIDIHTLSLIFSGLRNYGHSKSTIDIDFIENMLPSFSHKFPNHPVVQKINSQLKAIKTIKIGNKYIDFEAENEDGAMVRISEKIQGKVALIDLWASWCSPCRKLSKSMIPVYKKYKNKGFTIVGVACEYKNTNAFKIAIKKDEYPWLNLIELDNQNKIWEKYGIAGSGGKTYLVDSKGYIIAIHPSAEEVDKILGELLN